ncbi:NADP-dependent oxidoreductase domain-containing protein 1 [Notolabrus celidotus]|uniref:NADP-dependent oxidoreductase domain-containing protein 1 n=1 Tax=Notolabrus celidotus TaxID=1203425 RepID=UPI00148FC480|nr:NADP-dependent oxidoreductase domain-containing protein 1 [Notolabrus celidotus]
MTMMDVTAGLDSFSFEAGLTEEEKKFIYLRSRAAGLTFCGCAHAVFLCKLLQSLRATIKSHSTTTRDSPTSEEDRDLCVGIVGIGHLGKQLLRSLLEKSGIKPSNIRISSRRTESTAEFIQAGVGCFINIGRLAAWADILFLCCLPSHLPKVCADLRSHLSKHCLVYSFASAMPLTRLAHLLGHDFILKPQYVTGDAVGVWQSCTDMKTALKDPLLIEASCPLTMSSGISLGLNWVCAVLYSLLNICSSASLGSSDALCLINSILQETGAHMDELKSQTFICASYASSLLPEEPFPWISLTDAQTKDTPLQCCLSSNKPMQQSISAAYKHMLQN